MTRKKIFCKVERRQAKGNRTITKREGKCRINMEENVLLYEKILQYLKDKINNKELLPGDRLPTEMELAEQFGVSRITSKRALEELRSAGLIYRVRGRGSFVAKPGTGADATGGADTGINYRKIIAFVIPFSCANGGIINTIRGASRIASEKGYILDVKYSNNDPKEERELLEMLYDKGVGGIIFYPISDRMNLEVMNIFSLNEYPIVSIDRYFESVPVSYVVSDNQAGEYEAVKYLLELGHRNIAFISDNRIEDATSVRNRYFGYCRALKERGVAIRPEFVKNGDFFNLIREPSVRILQELLEEGVTAFCCINDYVAIFVLQCLKSLEVEVPQTVSVTGFDDLDISAMAYVPLTTVRQDMEKMGEAAAKYIVECIESGTYDYMKKTVPVELVVRESCQEI